VTRVFVAARVRLYREGLEAILDREETIEVVGAGGGRHEIAARVAETGPDVILLDSTLPAVIDLIREFAQPAATVKMIVLAPPDAESEVLSCAEAGIAGYITYDSSLSDLVATIRAARRGEFLCSPSIAGGLLRRVSSLAAGRLSEGPQEQLTRRELEVIRLLDEGLSNKQIALRLCIQLATVKHHVHHILEKLEVTRRSEAVARLRQSGLLQS
jgi:two-component system, NarL family, nitrate/nitrite response regulator NarL